MESKILIDHAALQLEHGSQFLYGYTNTKRLSSILRLHKDHTGSQILFGCTLRVRFSDLIRLGKSYLVLIPLAASHTALGSKEFMASQRI